MKTTSSRKGGVEVRVRVQVYERKTPQGNPGYLVAWRENKVRKWKSFRSRAEANGFARSKANAITTADTRLATMGPAELLEAAKARDALLGIGATVQGTLDRLLDAVQTCGGLSELEKAVAFYATHHAKVQDRLTADAVADYYEDKKSTVGPDHTANTRHMTNRFKADFGGVNIGNITTPQLSVWLAGLKSRSGESAGKKLANRTRWHYRQCLGNLFSFALERGWVHENPVDRIQNVSTASTEEVTLWTPEQLETMLKVADAKIMPFLVIGGFCGLRPAEIQRLEWSKVNLERKIITVDAKKSKTGSRRTVTIPDNAVQWLATCSNRTGLVYQGKRVQRDIEKLSRKSGLKWKKNALRHSAISYKLQLSQDINSVALAAGNSVKVINQHYRELVTESEAIKWFALVPERPANVVTLAQAG